MSEKSCQSCNFIATNKSQLYKHKLKHHPEAIMKKGAQVKNESTSVSSRKRSSFESCEEALPVVKFQKLSPQKECEKFIKDLARRIDKEGESEDEVLHKCIFLVFLFYFIFQIIYISFQSP